MDLLEKTIDRLPDTVAENQRLQNRLMDHLLEIQGHPRMIRAARDAVIPRQ